MSDEREELFALADDAVSRIVDADPCTATELGIIAEDGRLTDFSPSGVQHRGSLVDQIIAELPEEPSGMQREARITAEIMSERLGNLQALAAAGDHFNDVNVLASPPQAIRMSLELLPPDVAPVTLVGRLSDVDASLAGWRESLQRGIDDGIPAARRQALAVATQLRELASGWAPQFAETRGQDLSENDAAAVREAAEAAADAYVETAEWLAEHYAPLAREQDGVGRDAYARKAQAWNGDTIDLDATYAWGWQELESLTEDITATAAALGLADTPLDTKAALDADPRYRIDGEDALREYLTELTVGATADLNHSMFEIPSEVEQCDVRIAAAGAAAAPYYVPPSEDLSRPGSTWYPTLGKESFPKWWLTTVWYHEGVPGHHLQFGLIATMKDQLSRFQRTFGATSGHVEGWALYAERLMLELGYFDDPGLRFGYLSAQLMRAVRVIVDIGMHTDQVVPDGYPEAGAPITPALAERMLIEQAMLEPDFAASEVNRYLGLPGQAISYKVGERDWLALREAARIRKGGDFDLRDWHMQTLELGPMGLGPFRELANSL